ncbi:hypothetical protein F444_17517, partial [Phytophthora nicotianae P1976]
SASTTSSDMFEEAIESASSSTLGSDDASGSEASDSGSSDSSSEVSGCDEVCTDDFDPVTDEDGVTYSNKCFMQMAKCKQRKNGKAKKIYSADGSNYPLEGSRDSESPIQLAEPPTGSTKSEKPSKSLRGAFSSSGSDNTPFQQSSA